MAMLLSPAPSPARPSFRFSSLALASALAAALALGGPGCDPPPETLAGDAGLSPGGPTDTTWPSSPDDYAIVVLPDTQYYSSSWPEIFKAQTRWLVDNHDAQRISFVLHTGDIVDSDISEQWQPAADGLSLLDGQLPYAITAGNHDYFDLADRMGLINSYFPPSHFAQYPWFGGTFEAGHVENNFSLFSAGPTRWLVISLEFGPRDEALAWADGVLKLFSTTPAIIITHSYLYRDGSRVDHVGSPRQQFNPHNYIMMGQANSSVNDGEEMYSKLIEPNSNVKLVFCGHDVSGLSIPPGTTARLTSTRADGSKVHQILANYQTCTAPPCGRYDDGTGLRIVRGGNGFLRILRFSPSAQTIAVRTYSPYLDQSLTDSSNEFTLPLD
jgi:hypothetical protein